MHPIRGLRPALLLGLLTVSLAAPGRAEDEPYRGWAFSAGSFDTADSRLLELGVEYRFRPFTLFEVIALKPMVGISANEEGGVWAYGGLRYDWAVGERFTLTPSFAVALYERGDGKELGQALEFRSAIEVTYRIRGGHRIGAAFYHVSNASISDTNPGSNSFVFVWSLGR